MSTILDALRKAQEETGDKRQPPVGEHPAASAAVAPARRPRRRLGWPVAVLGILVLALAGGFAVGGRVMALFRGGEPSPAAVQDVQVAARDDRAEGSPAAGSPPADAGVKQKPVADPDAAAAAARRAKRAAQTEAAAARRGNAPAEGAAIAAGQAARPEAAPSPYGQLHVFGAGERPTGDKPSPEDRLARLQQLRERMRARKDAAANGAPEENAAVPSQIFVPPPREEAAPGTASKPAVAAAQPSEKNPPQNAVPAAGGSAPAGVVHELTVDAAPAEVAQPAQPAAPAAPDAQAPEPAVGVSIANAHADEAADGGATAPAAPEPRVAAAAPEARVAAPAPQPRPAAAVAPEPAVAVASLTPPPQPAPADPESALNAAAPRAAAQPVLRHAPGGAPQVAINILQWSAEPARRFAFVSVDGGNMTQVREGDHIGGLTVKHIHQQMIEFGFNDGTFLLRAN